MRRNKSQSEKGQLIVFEGPDESGKTTVSKQLATALEARGQSCLWLAFPGHEPNTLGAEIYALHHDPRFAAAPALSVQLLHVAAHVEAIQLRILPALTAGQWVVLDRYWWSTLAYGLAAGVDRRSLESALDIERRQWRRIKPAAAFVFARALPNMKRQPAQRAPLMKIYRQIILRERRSHPVTLVDNNGPLEEAVNLVSATVFKLLPSSQ
jgi:thymidylate kinase